MRRLIPMLAAIACLAPIATASAAPPRHVAYPVDFTRPVPELGELCGVPVSYTISGVFKGIVFYDNLGAITGEIDTQPATRIIWNSSETGKSYEFFFATAFRYEYPGGASPGSPAVVTASGFVEKIPGLPPVAGRVVFPDATVMFLDDGVPIVDYGEPSLSVGRENDWDASDAAICAALT